MHTEHRQDQIFLKLRCLPQRVLPPVFFFHISSELLGEPHCSLLSIRRECYSPTSPGTSRKEKDASTGGGINRYSIGKGVQ